MRKRYAIIGISGRSRTFTDNILNTYKGRAEIVALLDRNHKRMEVFNKEHGMNIPCYNEKEFNRMITETKPDCAIISTIDATHHTYVIAALKRNIDAVCEKPMTVDEKRVRAIIAAKNKSKGNLQITFNARYQPVHTAIYDMIRNGKIGKPVHVDFNTYLDTFHGASFFKRWNRYENQGGSLLVHKACHHFDLVNWWLGQKPVEVFAYGKLNYYNPNSPHNPEKIDGRRCSTCRTKCPYYLRHCSPTGGDSKDEHLVNFNNPGKNELFGAVDGYYADRCIFDSGIDTWDTFCAIAKYDGGAMMSFSLNASLPYEGYRLAINGTEGRIESDCVHGSGGRLPFPKPRPQNIRYFPLFGEMQTIKVMSKGGGHGGADPLLMKEIFAGKNTKDRAKRFAAVMDGAMSVLVGVAARTSLKTGRPVKIADLLNERRQR